MTNTREKIIVASITLFSEQGYEGTSMNNIADQVGIKKPSLYAHFSNKEDIFYHALEKIANDYSSFMKKILLDTQYDTTERKLLDLLSAYFRAVVNQDKATESFHRFLLYPPVELKEKVQEIFGRYDQLYRNLLSATVEEGKQHQEICMEVSTVAIVNTYLCILSGLELDTHYYDLDDSAQEIHISQIWEVFWRGIKL